MKMSCRYQEKFIFITVVKPYASDCCIDYYIFMQQQIFEKWVCSEDPKKSGDWSSEIIMLSIPR